MQKNKFRNLIFFFVMAIFALTVFSVGINDFSSASAESINVEQQSGESVSEGTLPSSYFLFSQTGFSTNTGGLTSNVGDQKQSDLCWAFSSNTALETTLYKSGIVASGTTLNFSELDLAYTSFVLSRGWTTLGGGAFELAYEYYSSENGPVNQQSWEASAPWTSGNSTLLKNYYQTNIASNPTIMSGYSVLESYFFPSRSGIIENDSQDNVASSVTEEKILANRNNIKEQIQNVGACTASIYMNSSSYLAGSSYCCTSSIASSNHMVTLVGWDDNYVYGSHTGAYIVQNSYGKNWCTNGFFYVMYDDTLIEDDVCCFKRVDNNLSDTIEYDNMAGFDYANQFITFEENQSGYYTSFLDFTNTVYTANIYQRTSVENQRIARIKVPLACVMTQDQYTYYYTRNNAPVTFKVYIVSGMTNSSTSTLSSMFSSKIPVRNDNATTGDEYLFTASQTGFYTIELENRISISGNYFAIIFEVQDGVMFYMDNNPSGLITNPTYKRAGASPYSWSIYGGSEECVLPMIVQTEYILSNIDYVITGTTCTYDGQVHNPNVTINTNCEYTVSYKVDDGAYSTELPNLKNVNYNGTAPIYYTVVVKVESEFYNTVVKTVYVMINRKTLTITPNPTTIIYGDDYLYPTAEVSGYIGGEVAAYSGRLSVSDFDITGLNDVGEYNIIIGNYTLSDNGKFILSNYNVSFVSDVKYTVTPKTIYVVPNELSKQYMESDPDLSFEVTGVEGTQEANISVTLVREVGEEIGSYEISLSGNIVVNDDTTSGFYSDNYNVEFSSTVVYFTITRRAIVITPDSNQSKVYNEITNPDPIFTYSYAGNIETPSFTGALSRTSGEEAGNYQITLGTLALADNTESGFDVDNYYIALSSTIVYFRINNGTSSTTYVCNISDNYNGLNHYINPSSGADVTVTYCDSDHYDESNSVTENIGKKDCGSYAISFKFVKQNYEPSYETAYIIISPINITITPKANQQTVYGGIEQIEYNYSGQVSGEVPSFSSGYLSRENSSNKNVGQYLITNNSSIVLQDNGSFLADNYNLVFDNSSNIKYSITKKILVVTPDDNQSKTYGRTDSALSYTSSGYEYLDEEDFVGNLSRNEGENVGFYTITLGTLALAESICNNYTLTLDDSKTYKFEITSAGVIIQINDKESFYGKISFNDITYSFLDGTEANFLITDDLQLSYICLDENNEQIGNTTRKKEGGYSISATSNNSNYSVTVQPGTYTINYREYTVSFTVLDVVKTKQVEHFSKVSSLPEDVETSITGYDFYGWTLNGVAVQDVLNYEVVGNVSFVADVRLVIYNVYYILNGGLILSTATRNFNITTATFVLAIPTRTGYNFRGYYETINFASGSEITQIVTGSSRNYYAYAKWEICTYTISTPVNTVSYDVLLSSHTNFITYNETYTLRLDLTSSYNKSYSTIKVYARWSTTNEREEINHEAIPQSSGDGICYQYKINNVSDGFTIEIEGITLNVYAINFIVDGVIVSTVNLSDGSSYSSSSYPTIPSKEYYDDVAPVWSVTEITNAQSDLDITAIYTPNIYIVTFVMEDGKEIQVETAYGNSVDISSLQNEYKLGLFEYFVYTKSIDNISGDVSIGVKVESNIYIFYIVCAVVGALIVISIIASIIKRKRRHQLKWWAYSKVENIEIDENSNIRGKIGEKK